MKVQHLYEMARAKIICPTCGLSMAGNHHWYKGGWRCKQKNIDAYNQAQAAGAGTTLTPTSTMPASATPNTQTTAPPGTAAALNTSAPAVAAPNTPTPPTTASKAKTMTPKAPASVQPKAKIAGRRPPPATDDEPDEREVDEKIRYWASVEEPALDRPRIFDEDLVIRPANNDLGVIVDVKGDRGVYVIGRAWKQLPFAFGKIEGAFVWSGTNISTCANMPEEVVGTFALDANHITSFKGCPKRVGGEVTISSNPASSLEGIPREIGGGFSATDMPNLESLSGIDQMIDSIGGTFVVGPNVKHSIVGLVLIPGITRVDTGNSGADAIINKHLAAPDPDVFAIQAELIDAGFDALAEYE